MKQVTVKLAYWDSSASDFTCMVDTPAYYVPGTEDLLAVHHPAGNDGVLNQHEWAVSHVPTGFALGFKKPTRAAAIAFGLKMYRAAKAGKVPLRSVHKTYLQSRWAKVLRKAGIVARPVL